MRLFVCHILIIALSFSIVSAQIYTSNIFATRSILNDTIYYEGAPTNTRATVNMVVYASSETLITVQPSLDVLILSDNSDQMGRRFPGDRAWVPPMSRIQAAYNTSVNLLDSTLTDRERVAHLRFSGRIDTQQAFSNDFAFQKEMFDSSITGDQIVSGVECPGSAVYAGILEALRYVVENKRDSNTIPMVIAYVGSDDNASGSYGTAWHTGMPNLGDSKQKAVDSVLTVIDSLTIAQVPFRIYIVSIGSYADTASLKRIARNGHGVWAYTATGVDLFSYGDVFYHGSRFWDYGPTSLYPGAPLIVEVLGPDVHYVPGSFSVSTGAGYVTPALRVDTVEDYTRLSFIVDSLRMNFMINLQYEITAALSNPDASVAKRIRFNNTPNDDPVNYSLIQYRDINDSLIVRPLGKRYVYVKSEFGGVYLSMTGAGIPVTPVPSVIAGTYTHSDPGIFPDTTLYAIRMDLATDTVTYTLAPAAWYFYPDSNWTATTLNGIIANNQTVGITAGYDYADTASLRIQYPFNGQIYGDTILFSFSGNVGVEARPCVALPKSFSISDPMPNPFNPTVTLNYAVPIQAPVSLTIFNIRGEVVSRLVGRMHEPGYFQAVWDGRDVLGRSVQSGLYICRMEAGSFVQQKKMLLVK